jgi:hypothetical protein
MGIFFNNSSNSIADMLHSIRTNLDKYQPSVGTAVGLVSGPSGWLTAIPGPQALAVNNIRNMKGPVSDAPPAAPAAPQAPQWGAGATPMPFPTIGGALMPQAGPQGSPVPLPQPRPAAAPGAPMSLQPSAPGPTSLAGPANPHQGLFNRVAATLQGHPSPNGLIGMIGHALNGQPSAPQQGASMSNPGSIGFFQHNAAMMRDPATGSFIDPSAAATQSQIRGPDLINKMMGYLSGKPFGSIGNNNDPSTQGSG